MRPFYVTTQNDSLTRHERYVLPHYQLREPLKGERGGGENSCIQEFSLSIVMVVGWRDEWAGWEYSGRIIPWSRGTGEDDTFYDGSGQAVPGRNFR